MIFLMLPVTFFVTFCQTPFAGLLELPVNLVRVRVEMADPEKPNVRNFSARHSRARKRHINFEHINFLKVGTTLGQPAG